MISHVLAATFSNPPPAAEEISIFDKQGIKIGTVLDAAALFAGNVAPITMGPFIRFLASALHRLWLTTARPRR